MSLGMKMSAIVMHGYLYCSIILISRLRAMTPAVSGRMFEGGQSVTDGSAGSIGQINDKHEERNGRAETMCSQHPATCLNTPFFPFSFCTSL